MNVISCIQKKIIQEGISLEDAKSFIEKIKMLPEKLHNELALVDSTTLTSIYNLQKKKEALCVTKQQSKKDVLDILSEEKSLLLSLLNKK